MDVSQLWPRYAKIWSSDAKTRQRELLACLADDATYCDPNGLLTGREALSDYMGGFQENFAGNGFRIIDVISHDGGSLARWAQHDAGGSTLHYGMSFATHDEEGRLQNINGFFPYATHSPSA
ncbi:nuclear transport factor 2 family protein [Actibacterium sp. D379-3]